MPRLAEDWTATASGAPTQQRAKYGEEAGTQVLPVDTIPKPKFDKTAYQREYMRTVYRPKVRARKAKLKTEREEK